jgi:hypothetical protein
MMISEKGAGMMDIVFLLGGAAYFVLSAAYAVICGKL